MPGIERYQTRPPSVAAADRQAVAVHRLAGEMARRGHTVEMTTVTVRPTVVPAPRVAVARPVPVAEHRPPVRRRGGRAVRVAVTTVAVLAGPAGLGYWFAATAAGWALLKAAAAVVGGVLVLLLVLALLGRRCPGVRIHCGGCSE